MNSATAIPRPYIDRSGREPTLIIPSNSDPKYHWWGQGQSIYKTLVEMGAEKEIIQSYCGKDEKLHY